MRLPNRSQPSVCSSPSGLTVRVWWLNSSYSMVVTRSGSAGSSASLTTVRTVLPSTSYVFAVTAWWRLPSTALVVTGPVVVSTRPMSSYVYVVTTPSGWLSDFSLSCTLRPSASYVYSVTSPDGVVTEVRSPEELYLYRVTRPSVSVTEYGRPGGTNSPDGLNDASPPVV